MKISTVHTVFLLLAIFAFVGHHMQEPPTPYEEEESCNGDCNVKLGACIDKENPDTNKQYCDNEWHWCIAECAW